MKIKFLLHIVLILTSQTGMAATVLLPEKVSVTGKQGFLDIGSLRATINKSLPTALSTYCSEIAEVSRTILCISRSKERTNEMFTRMGIFWGSGRAYPAGDLIANDDFELLSLEKMLVAHNLPGQVISDFVDSASKASSELLKLNTAEAEFKTSIMDLPSISSMNGQYYVIAFPADSPVDYRTIVTHEIHHAQFYLDPVLGKTVTEFWNSAISDALYL